MGCRLSVRCLDSWGNTNYRGIECKNASWCPLAAVVLAVAGRLVAGVVVETFRLAKPEPQLLFDCPPMPPILKALFPLLRSFCSQFRLRSTQLASRCPKIFAARSILLLGNFLTR